MENTYNGWVNRATWLTNLHFSEKIHEYINNNDVDNNDEVYDFISDDVVDSDDLKEYLDSLLEIYREQKVNEVNDDIFEIMVNFNQIDFEEIYDANKSDDIK